MLDQTKLYAALCRHRNPARQMASDYLIEHAKALVNAAGLLGGASAALGVESLVCEVQSETGRLSLHTRRRFARLEALLSLEQTDETDLELLDFSCAIDPCDPRVHEICMLSEGLTALLHDLDVACDTRPADAVKVRVPG